MDENEQIDSLIEELVDVCFEHCVDENGNSDDKLALNGVTNALCFFAASAWDDDKTAIEALTAAIKRGLKVQRKIFAEEMEISLTLPPLNS